MSWVAVAVGGTALGALTSYSQAKQQERQNKANMLAQAAQDRYSPWTGAAIQTGGANSPNVAAQTLGGALGGGMTGAMMGSQFKKLQGAGTGGMQTTQGPMMAGGAGDNGGIYGQMQRRQTLYGDMPETMIG
jgi:hypothetical protein